MVIKIDNKCLVVVMVVWFEKVTSDSMNGSCPQTESLFFNTGPRHHLVSSLRIRVQGISREGFVIYKVGYRDGLLCALPGWERDVVALSLLYG